MKKFFGWVTLVSLFMGSVAQADLDTWVHISENVDSIGDVTGDISGQGEVTVWDLPGVGDLWNDGDSFTYVHDSERHTGDFTATVRVAGQTAALDGRWGKGGVMIRHDLESDNSNAMPAVYTGNGSQVDPPTADSNVTDHSPVDVRVNGRTGNGANGGGYERPMLRDGVPFRNNLAPPAAPGDMDAPFNQAWLRVQYQASTGTIVGAYADDVDGAPGEWAYSAAINDVDIPDEGWYVGLAYSSHNSMVADDLITDDNEEGLHGMIFDNYSFVPEYLLPISRVGDKATLSGKRSDLEFGDPEVLQGATNHFYNGNIRGVIEGDDGFLAKSGRGPDGAGGTGVPQDGAFGAIHNPVGLWGGNSDVTIGGTAYPRYPDGTFTADNQDNYAGIVTGQIWVEGNGDYTFVDGVDDFTMLAVDTDGNGELDGVSTLTDADVPPSGEFGGGFDDIAILDDDWVGTNGGGGDGAGNNLSVMTFSDVAAGGEWRDFEMWTGEEGGGDAGLFYYGPTDEFDPLDLPLSVEEQDAYIAGPDRLQTVASPIIGGNTEGSLDPGLDYVVGVGGDGNGTICVDDLEGVLNSTLDLAGGTVTIEDMGGATEGQEFLIFDADVISGFDELDLTLPEGPWDISRLGTEGILVYGEGGPVCNPNTQGDLDGNGIVEFADFLVLSNNYGKTFDPADHTKGDIDCDGEVAFADFLVLSNNFGKEVGGAQSVPEPSGIMLFGIAGLMVGLLRRRRG